MTDRPKLLPQDRYLAHLLGITEEEFQQFRAYAIEDAAAQPPPVAVAGVETLATVALVSSLLSVGFTIAASFFKPKPTEPGRLVARDRSLSDTTRSGRFAPRYGIEAGQDVLGLGETIPVVYALREAIGDTLYGGVRFNSPMLWSQILSMGSSQMLRAIFMVGEGLVDGLDLEGFALGNNSLAAYDLLSAAANERAARLTVYWRNNGGRIVGDDRIRGRIAANDPGNLGGDDIFQLRSIGNNFAADFCAASKPSTSTTFGLYTPIGNNLAYKLNPSIRPAVQARLKPRGRKGNSTLKCDPIAAVLVQREKHKGIFSTRSGLVTGPGVPASGSVAVDTEMTYRLDSSTEPLDEPIIVDVDKDGAVGTWTADFTIEERPRLYQRDVANSPITINWNDPMSLSGVSVAPGGDALEVTATFDYESILGQLAAATRGQYRVLYEVELTRDDETLQAEFDLIITKQSRRNYTATTDTSGSSFTSYSIDQTTDANGNVTNVELNQDDPGTLSVTTEINESSVTDIIDFDVIVDKDSGPIEFQQTPLRVTAKLVFPYDNLDAAAETLLDVSSAIADRQTGWEQALIPGEVYKVGSALAVCMSKSPTDAAFQSDADEDEEGSGQTVTATLRCIRAGQVMSYTVAKLTEDREDRTAGITATSGAHIHRCAIAQFVTSRRCQVVEIGFRSALGIRKNAITNFRTAQTYEEVDGRACIFKEGNNVKRGKRLIIDSYQSSIISSPEERFSFNRLSFRNPDLQGDFTEISACFGFRGINQQPVFNYLRLVMPSLNHWEFRIEPLSGWEIRNSIAAGGLVILDAAKAGLVSGGNSGVSWHSNGRAINRARSRFNLHALKRGADIDADLPRLDENNYVDAWGRLAEFFCYNELESTAQSGPEHEVVYLNEIVPNATPPQYDNIALLGLNIASSVEWQQLSQFSAYITGGTRVRRLRNALTLGPSHLFPDVLLDLMTNARYGRGALINDNLIDIDSFSEAAEWCYARRYFFDSVVGERLNIRQWAADVAAAHLLIFGESDGKFFLRPALQFTPVPIRGLFTAGNIYTDSHTVQKLDPEERDAIQVSITYREERPAGSVNARGVFPVEREMLVREVATSSSAPIERISVSGFCTSRQHALESARYVILMRRLVKHAIRFRTLYEGVLMRLAAGDYINVVMDVAEYDEFSNGIVTGTGALVSTKPIANGTYTVLAWDGQATSTPQTTSLVVSGGGTTATPTGIVFSLNSAAARQRTYRIERIEPGDEGTYEIDAIEMPTNSSGVLLMAQLLTDDANWVVEE
jgi:hypothetical protein